MLDLDTFFGTGGRTRFNRAKLSLPKAHWTDAACVDMSGASVQANETHNPLSIKMTDLPRTEHARHKAADQRRQGDNPGF